MRSGPAGDDARRGGAEGRALVLVVDDEPNIRKVLGALLEQAGYEVALAASALEALELVRAHDPDLVITDLRMPGVDGLDLLRRLREDFPEIPVVLLTAHGTVENAVEAMKRGAHDFLTKPFDKTRVLDIVGKAVGQAERARREFHGGGIASEPTGLIGRSAAITTLKRLIERVAPSPASVLITGETGTGKELVARALHRLSPRREAPFVAVNCGALPEGLVEAELLGHERGAFTGAERIRPGRFELADGGTLFLDEVGELPPVVQVKLLRVLQDGQIDRIGSTAPLKVDVRLVAATHRDIQKAIDQERFRSDLFFRLRVIEIQVPPLQERLDDIPLLVEFFLGKHASRLGRRRPEIAEGALDSLASRLWPGNVRELENVIERAMILGRGDVLELEDVEPAGRAPDELARRDADPRLGPVPRSAGGMRDAARAAAAETERRLIRAALEATGGNITRAAERLGVSRRGLQFKLKDPRLTD
ncbi:MAG: sigma-54-dependent transcriptional regulator [Candidatus Rokuibacteriota bacterium]